MAARRNVLSQTENAFWREVYRDVLKALITKHGSRRRIGVFEAEAAARADHSVELLRARRTGWGAQ
jgi:hypothetical protein